MKLTKEFVDKVNHLTSEEIASAMEGLTDTDVLEWAVRFEALGHDEPQNPRVTPRER